MNARELIPFLRSAGIFDSWSDEKLINHLVWRARHGQLLVSQTGDGLVTGALAWGTAASSADLARVYGPPANPPRYIYWDFVVCVPPTTMPDLWKRFTTREPGWRGAWMFGHRDGRLKTWSADRFAKIMQRSGGNLNYGQTSARPT